MTTPTPDDGRLWAVTVTIPGHLDEGDRDDLFDLVADTALRWEPDDRDGWDIDVSAGLDTPCPYVVTGDEGTSHCTLAESAASALAAEVAALRTAVRYYATAEATEQPVPDLMQALTDSIATYRTAARKARDAARKARDAARDRTAVTPPVCATCNDTGLVAQSPGQPGDGHVPCPDCTEDTNHA